VSEADVARRINQLMSEQWFNPTPEPEPKYRYFQKTNGHMYCWTVEKGEYDECEFCLGGGIVLIGSPEEEECPACKGKGVTGGWYASFIYRATGSGSRTGNAERWDFDEKSLVKHRKRKDAKARALRLYRKANG
jgi:hypothetical protein